MNNNKNFSTILSILLISLFACKQKLNDKQSIEVKQLTIDTFSTIPPEIEGCSCTFSNDSIEYKNDKYIYANNFANLAFVKINGVMTKFETYSKEGNSKIKKYTNDNYEMTIQIENSKPAGYESSEMSGQIKLSDKKGYTLTKKFYGICGC